MNLLDSDCPIFGGKTLSELFEMHVGVKKIKLEAEKYAEDRKSFRIKANNGNSSAVGESQNNIKVRQALNSANVRKQVHPPI